MSPEQELDAKIAEIATRKIREFLPAETERLIVENAALRDWKESAMTVLAEWDRVGDLFRGQMTLGASKAAETLRLVAALRDALREARGWIDGFGGDLAEHVVLLAKIDALLGKEQQ